MNSKQWARRTTKFAAPIWQIGSAGGAAGLWLERRSGAVAAELLGASREAHKEEELFVPV